MAPAATQQEGVVIDCGAIDRCGGVDVRGLTADVDERLSAMDKPAAAVVVRGAWRTEAFVIVRTHICFSLA